MPTGYYLVCLETQRYIWICTLGDLTSVVGVDADSLSSFCLVHRNNPQGEDLKHLWILYYVLSLAY